MTGPERTPAGPPARGEPERRPIRAAGPGDAPESLRPAYLELLKLALCDLVGSRTSSLTGLPGGGVASRELTGADLAVRADGGDWPAHALTMCGLRRLDDLQRCVETIVEAGVPGDVIEAGAWRGGASILMRATLNVLGARDRTVWVADSFQGFPSARPGAGDQRAYPRTVEPYLAAFDYLSVPREEVEAAFLRLGLRDGVEFVAGFFADTLPTLVEQTWSLIRLDADTYDPTWLALHCLYPALNQGGYVVIDDYGAVEECRVAVERFRAEQVISQPLEAVDSSCVRWRKA